MKRYHFHPDKFIYIYNNGKVYYESLLFAKFDLGNNLVLPIENSDEFEYIIGYGTRNFNRTGMISFNDEIRLDLDNIIENIDILIKKKNNRSIIDDSIWEIPEDMKVYTPPTTTLAPENTTTEVPNVN
jgi:hypothetical protein